MTTKEINDLLSAGIIIDKAYIELDQVEDKDIM